MARGSTNPEVAPKRPWVEMDNYVFPLVEGSGLQMRPVTQFSPASTIGPANRPPSDPRFLVTLFADLTRGAGIDEQEEIDGVNGYRKGTFDTRNKRGFGMPPVVETLPASFTISGHSIPSDILPGKGGTRCFYVRCQRNEFLYISTDVGSGGYWAYDLKDDTTEFLAQRRLTAAIAANQNIIGAFSDTNGIGRSAIMTTANQSPDLHSVNVFSTNMVGLAEFDNRFWSFNSIDKETYAALDPVNGADWVSMSLGNDTVIGPKQLLRGKDVRGEDAIIMVAEDGLWGLDQDPDPAEWQRFVPGQEWGYRRDTLNASNRYGATPIGTIWRKDSTLYAVWPDAEDEYALHIVRHDGTARDIGPLQTGDFDVEERFERILKVEGNTHYLYAWCAAGDRGAADEVMCMSDTGGWHTLWVNPDTATNPIVTGTVDGGNVYIVHQDGTVRVIRDRDNNIAPHKRYPSGGGYTQTSAELYTGWTDIGLPNSWKQAAYLRVMAVQRDGTPGLGDDNSLEVSFRRDAPTFTSLATIPDSAEFPVYIPLPDASEQGSNFRQMELLLEGTCNGEPFLIQELAVFAERWTEPFWAYQFSIDLRESTFRKFVETGIAQHDLGELVAKLEALAGKGSDRPPFKFNVTFGHGEFAESSIVAGELMYGATINPGRGDGIYQVTVRDMTMPHDNTVPVTP